MCNAHYVSSANQWRESIHSEQQNNVVLHHVVPLYRYKMLRHREMSVCVCLCVCLCVCVCVCVCVFVLLRPLIVYFHLCFYMNCALCAVCVI